MDEMFIYLTYRLSRVWYVGKRPVYRLKFSKADYMSVFGSIDLDGNVKVKVYGRANSDTFEDFVTSLFEELYSDYDIIYLLLDNARFHVPDFLRWLHEESGRRFRFIFLPPYAPDLNRAEMLWRVVEHELGFVFPVSKEAVLDVIYRFDGVSMPGLVRSLRMRLSRILKQKSQNY